LRHESRRRYQPPDRRFSVPAGKPAICCPRKPAIVPSETSIQPASRHISTKSSVLNRLASRRPTLEFQTAFRIAENRAGGGGGGGRRNRMKSKVRKEKVRF
jgi:hypothetical protein